MSRSYTTEHPYGTPQHHTAVVALHNNDSNTVNGMPLNVVVAAAQQLHEDGESTHLSHSVLQQHG